MRKYNVKWCRIWEFLESTEAETEEEATEKIQKERATAGSTIEIIAVIPIDIEEVKENGKKKNEESIIYSKRIAGGGSVKLIKVGSEKVEQKSKGKK